MGYERAYDRRGKPGTLGGDMRDLYNQMHELVIHLRAMCDYAHANQKTNLDKRLSDILGLFNELKTRYLNTKVMDEIEHSTLKSATQTDPIIERIRTALKAANDDLQTVAKEEMRDIISLLTTSRSAVANETRDAQALFENFKDFIARPNQFEAFLKKIDNFEKINKSKYAKNTALFFSTSTKATEPLPQSSTENKQKAGK